MRLISCWRSGWRGSREASPSGNHQPAKRLQAPFFFQLQAGRQAGRRGSGGSGSVGSGGWVGSGCPVAEGGAGGSCRAPRRSRPHPAAVSPLSPRCRANVAHTRQSLPDSGLGVRANVVDLFWLFPFRSEAGGAARAPGRSRPAARPRIVPACPKVCTGHVLYVL